MLIEITFQSPTGEPAPHDYQTSRLTINADLFLDDPDRPVIDITPGAMMLLESIGASSADLAEAIALINWHGSEAGVALHIRGYTYREADTDRMIEIDPDTPCTPVLYLH